MRWPRDFPRVVAELDLDKSALLEASAGTGKTYAIEHLVVRFLAEKPEWPLESLLLLSFTEKTAGELREKIRRRLKTEWQRRAEDGAEEFFWPAPVRARFFEAHLRCDEASIHTLHGFCHAALRAHALENGALFDGEVMEEHDLLAAALDGLLRGPWAGDATALRQRLAALAEGPADWRRWLVRLASAYQPDRGDRLDPAPDADSAEIGAAAESAWQTAAEEMQRAFAAVEQASFDFARYGAGFGHSKSGRDNFHKDALAGAVRALRESPTLATPESLADFFLHLSKNSKAYKHGFAATLSAAAAAVPAWKSFADACTRARAAAVQRADAAAAASRRRALAHSAGAVRAVRARMEWEKRRRGVLTYDDMVVRLWRAARERPEFAAGLRSRMRACVVDEFQDTDPLQWELLRILCWEGPEPRPLFLVGDPKQAIYGFRGGDLNTYFDARHRLHVSTLQGRAQGFSLSENHRSRPQLVQALNAVFAQAPWFGRAEAAPIAGDWHLPARSDAIAFTPASFPHSRAEEPGAPAVVLRDFTGIATLTEARHAVLDWIAQGIDDLLAGARGPLISAADGSRRAPAPGDIAVLVRTNAEALAAERFLRRRGLPCRVRRRGGLFDSPQADQMQVLLEALEDAGDPRAQARLLLLPFLRAAGSGWPAGLPEACPEPIRRWAEHAQARRWPALFRAVLYESGYLYRLAAETRGGSEVRILDLLARTLAEEGLRHGLSLRGLVQRFESLRRGESEETGIVSDAGVDARVAIMTLHLSKGLEFPVVYVSTLGQTRAPDFYTLRESTGFRHVLDKHDLEARAQCENQTRDEDKRLFYVGFTRAKSLLCVPLLPARFKQGSGPLGGFAADALRHAAEEHPAWFAWEEPAPASFRAETPTPEASAFAAPPERDPWEQAGAFFLERPRRLASYSQLARRAQDPEWEEDGKRANREDDPPGLEPAADMVTAEDLPPGAETGNALHEVLEGCDFAAALQMPDAEALGRDAVFAALAAPILRRRGLEEKFLPAVARVVWNALRMPLPDPAGGDAAPLAGITEKRHEVEFVFPVTGAFPPPEAAEIRRGQIRRGLLWGFIDLVFRRQGRYYLLDWKSNRLDRYDARAVAEDMRRHQYDLQYQLYAVALDRWLTARLPDYDPARHFGGLYYLYLRGAGPSAFSGFALRPTPHDLRESYPARLRHALGLQTGRESHA